MRPEVFFDVSRLVGRLLKGRLPTGVDRVDLAYIEHFAHRARAVIHFGGRPLLLSSKASQRIFQRLLNQRDVLGATLATDIVLGIAGGLLEPAPRSAVYLNTSHSGLLAPGLGLCLRMKGIQPIWMVHDLIPITHHEYCRPGEDERHTRRMRSVLKHAAALLTNSRATKDELVTFAQQCGMETPPCVVARLAPGLKAVEFGEPPLAKPYFVVVSTIEPRKNLAMLLQVWRQLAQRHGDNTPTLVLVGQRAWECENVIDLLERSAPLRGLVIEKGRCSDRELATLLKHARAMLFPSFVEGYGLPLAEALDIGTPVIASDLPVFREIAGEVPDYLDPLDGPAWLRAVEQYTPAFSARRTEQLKRIMGYLAPTWAQHFAVVDELIRSRQTVEDVGLNSARQA
jgi:glycosyltransferase involved in cell wall biosynthesis